MLMDIYLSFTGDPHSNIMMHLVLQAGYKCYYVYRKVHMNTNG